MKDFLSRDECYALQDWIQDQFINGKRLKVVEAATRKIMATMDEDMSINLATYLAEGRARENMAKIQDKYDRDEQIFRKKKEEEKSKKTPEKTKQGGAHALDKPNDKSCWFWTNNYTCKHKGPDGKCKFEHLHGVCGMPLGNGKYCLEAHRATDHK